MELSAFPPSQNLPPEGLLLVGHGTRQQPGLDEFIEVAEQVKQLAGEFIVEACFLEIAQPDVSAGIRKLVERGVKQIVVSPVLLFAAGHAKRDIPLAVNQALVDASRISVRQTRALECQPKIVRLSAQRFEEALRATPPHNCSAEIARNETLLLMVGRGNSDPTAIAEMHRFAMLRADQAGLGKVAVCFVAMAEPSLEIGLRVAAESSFRRIVVQPHLLFVGQVLQQIDAAVAMCAERQPNRQWIVTRHLGASPLVAQAVVDLCRLTKL